VEALLEDVDYLISSREFPSRLTGELDLLIALPILSRRFRCRLVAATLGEDGVLAWDGTGFHYSAAFAITPLDTTGAGDIFHAAFAYATMQGWGLVQTLEFSCAAAGLACMAPGARGGIASIASIKELIRKGDQRPRAYSQEQLEVRRATS
jgi:sulfofructose kinase